MKKLLSFLSFLFVALIGFSQSPNLINYQAVIRDANGDAIPNKAISLRLGIYEGSSGGIVRYEETHSDTTNSFGLFNLQIGAGTPTVGSMDSVRWGGNTQVLVIDVDLNGGTNWERLNTSQLVSVPYAMHATVAKFTEGDFDKDSTNEIQSMTLSNDTLFLSNGGGFVVLNLPSQSLDNDTTNELIQSITLTNDTLFVQEPFNLQAVNLSTLNQSGDVTVLDARITADSLTLLNASIIFNTRLINDSIRLDALEAQVIAGAYKDSSSTNEIQVISISNDTIFLTNGGFAILPTAGANNDNDSTNELIQSMALAAGTLTITEPNNVQNVNLSSLDQSAAVSGLESRYVADSTASSQARVANADSIDQVAANLTGHIATDNDLSSTNEIQVLSISNDTIFLTSGGFAVLPAGAANNDNDSTNELIQSMVLAGGTLTVTEPNNIQNVNLSSLDQSAAISGLDTRITNDSNALVAAKADYDSRIVTDSIRLNSTVTQISGLDTRIVNDSTRLNTLEGQVNAGAYLDSSASNEIQVISISNDTIFLTNGGFAVLPPAAANNDNDSTNELIQSMVLAAGTLTITEPNNVQNVNLSGLDQSAAISGLDTRITNDSIALVAAKADYDTRIAADSVRLNATITQISSLDTRIVNDSTRLNTLETQVNAGAYLDSSATNEIQVLSISNDTIFLTNGGFAVLPAGAANNDNDSTNEYVDSLFLSGRDLILSQSGGLNLDTTDLSLINYWNESSNNLSYTMGDVSIGTSAGSGVLSVIDSNKALGILSRSLSSGINIAIDGIAQSSATNNNTTTGILGRAVGTGGTSGTGFHYGVYGTSTGGSGSYGAGVYGEVNGNVTSISRGVDGNSASPNANFNQGTFGFTNQSRTSASGYNAGIGGEASGHSTTNYAVVGLMPGLGNRNYGGAFFAYGNVSGAPKNYGAYGYAWGADTNVAIYGYAADDATATNYGVYGEINGTTGRAGYFIGDVTINGDLDITGAISKGSGTFKIDHPLDPKNKYLVHSFVESPEMMNVYNGNVTTDANGIAVVTLPSYFEVANKDFRYQLTPIGAFAQCIIKEEISGNRFVIATDKPNIKVSWQVTGVRNDPYAKEHRVVAEPDKTGDEKGKYLHPELYNQDDSKEMYPAIDGGMNKEKLEELKKSGGHPTPEGESETPPQ